MKYFFISDTHFNHKNIIDYCDRPFKDVSEMNEAIIRNWNNVVSPEDFVFFLGDFALGNNTNDLYRELSNSLNGTIYFLRGNHDKSRAVISRYFNLIDRGTTVSCNGYNFILSHHPLYDSEIPKGYINIHGHIHNNLLNSSYDAKCHYNVSADVIGFAPIFVNDIIDNISSGSLIPKRTGIDISRKDDNMRKLATVQTILSVDSIPDADAIEVVTVKGWKVVVKKGEFQVGDKVVYFEIDSLIPRSSITEFLMEDEYMLSVRLRTRKLRGQVSQGLVISLEDSLKMAEELNGAVELFDTGDGTDLSDLLHVEKYEPPVTYGNEGRCIYWPFSIPKTDEERIQNIPEVIDKLIEDKTRLCISVKLDGTSMTVIHQPDGIHVAGRNNDFDKTDDIAFNNKYWSTARRYGVTDALEEAHKDNPSKFYAVQGELVGPGIQGNKMNLSDLHYYIFNLFVSEDGCGSWKKLGYNELTQFCIDYNLDHVPYIYSDFDLEAHGLVDVESILKFSEGTYRDNAEGYFPNAKANQQREGLVFRTLDHQFSFKVVNNIFLLKGGE